MEFDEDEREVETAVESAREANGTGTSSFLMCTATDVIGCESEQSDNDDSSGNDTNIYHLLKQDLKIQKGSRKESRLTLIKRKVVLITLRLIVAVIHNVVVRVLI